MFWVAVCPVISLLSWIKEELLIFLFVCLFSSSLVGMGWWCPSYLHAGLETGSFSFIFEDEFSRYRILGWLPLPTPHHQHFKYVTPLPHGSMVCDWKSNVILSMDHLYMTRHDECLLSCWFQDSHFLLAFDNLTMWLCINLLIYPAWNLWAIWSCRFVSFINFGSFTVIIFSIFFLHIFSSSQSKTSVKCILVYSVELPGSFSLCSSSFFSLSAPKTI